LPENLKTKNKLLDPRNCDFYSYYSIINMRAYVELSIGLWCLAPLSTIFQLYLAVYRLENNLLNFELIFWLFAGICWL